MVIWCICLIEILFVRYGHLKWVKEIEERERSLDINGDLERVDQLVVEERA